MRRLKNFEKAPQNFDVVFAEGYTNRQRAERAARAIATYLNKDSETAVLDDLVTDLIADLTHFCDGHGLDFEAARKRAKFHHYLEKLA